MRTAILWSIRALFLAPLVLAGLMFGLMLALDAACERLTGEGLI